MEQTVLFGIGLIPVFVVLPIMWRKTFLDMHRDRLFDLREDVREYFLNCENGLSHPVYIHLRNILNGHIRFLEETGLISLFLFQMFLSKNKEISEHIKRDINKPFECQDKEMYEFSQNSRYIGIVIVQDYLLTSSLPVFMALVFLGIGKIVRDLFRHTSLNLRGWKKSSIAYLSRKILPSEDNLEERSFFNSNTPKLATP